MRWTNKIMSGSQDHNNSRLSSRSLSKFKKVNLQKSQVEISSNDHFQKSELKLTSVQKIKHSNLNKSYICNYIGLGTAKSSPMQSPVSTIMQKNKNQLKTLKTGENKNSVHFQAQKHSLFHQENNKNISSGFFQGFAMFRKQTAIQQLQKLTKQEIPAQIQQMNQDPFKKLQGLVQNFHKLFEEFQTVSQNIKQKLTENSLLTFRQIQKNLFAFIKDFENKFEAGINQLVNLTFQSVNKFVPQNTQTVSAPLSQFASSQSLYKIKCLEQQQTYPKDYQNQHSKNRPNSFKNKFKQLVTNSDQNLIMRNQKGFQNLTNQAFSAIQQKGKKIQRKRTNQIIRINSLLDNQSTVLNQNSLNQDQNRSTNSIKYCKLGDRSASKSVRKLHDKIVMIKNIFKPDRIKAETQRDENNENLRKVNFYC